MKHQASCSCGQLKLTYTGKIKRTAICHCFECQKRTGSVFGVQTRLEKSKVEISGLSTPYSRTGDDGGKVDFHFCPTCGSTVYWFLNAEGFSEYVIAAIGCFNDPQLPAPVFSVYKARKHHWVEIPKSVTDNWD